MARHYATMMAVARTYVKSRAVAEEVVQEAWLGVLQGLDRFEGRSSLKTWIIAIVVNKAKTRARARGPQRAVRVARWRATSRPSSPSASAAPARRIPGIGAPPGALGRRRRMSCCEDRETLRVAMRAIAALPPAQQAVIRMRDLEGSAPTRSARRSRSRRPTSASCCTARAHACARRWRSISMPEPPHLPGDRRARHRLPRARAAVRDGRDVRGAHQLLRRLRGVPRARCARRSRPSGSIERGGRPARRRASRLLAAFRELEAGVIAYKFLRADGSTVFSQFRWPLPATSPARGSRRRSIRAAAASTPAVRATCRTGSARRCTRSSSTARSSRSARR